MTGPQLSHARELISEASRLYRGSIGIKQAIAGCDERTRQPLHIAFSGSLKAGKSTLLNALVGDEIAPSDATECTKVVTWYRHAHAPSAVAWRESEGVSESSPVIIDRSGRNLAFHLGSRTASDIDCIEVGWPSESLEKTMLIDTPGMSSLSHDVSERTSRLLTPERGPSEADAVVYLLRTLNDTDIRFLREVGSRLGGETGPLGIIGVVARADEIGAGRPDAMGAARDVADRFAAELESAGLCQAVVPVSGLVALAARTLRESEFADLQRISRVPAGDRDLALLSADRFTRSPDLPVAPEARSALMNRFGVFGVRVAIGFLQDGVASANELAQALLTHSGVDDLTELIDVHFRQRSEELRAHSALLTLREILSTSQVSGTGELLARVDRSLASDHGLEELRVLARLKNKLSGVPDVSDLKRILGGRGTSPQARLGVPSGTPPDVVRQLARDSALRWRSRAQHPLNDPFAAAAYRSAARSAEGLMEDAASL